MPGDFFTPPTQKELDEVNPKYPKLLDPASKKTF